MSRMTLEIVALADGWADFRLSIGDHRIETRASHLHDAIGELARAAVRLARGGLEARCALVEEPGALILLVQRDPKEFTRAHVRAFAAAAWSDRAMMSAERSAPLFEGTCAVSDLTVAVSSSLRRLLATYGADDYRRRWGWAFPDQEIEALLAA